MRNQDKDQIVKTSDALSKFVRAHLCYLTDDEAKALGELQLLLLERRQANR